MSGNSFNVLSLFDGMSCGQIALDRLGIQVDNYYASEINKDAIIVTQSNYPKTQQLGNVLGVKGDQLPQIDLLIGGSPCTGFSYAGKQLNFSDVQSKLFFEYVRILKECNPRYFLLENVFMKKEYEDIITSYLGVTPVRINSNLVSAQNRPRIYWTNIEQSVLPEDKGITLRDILDWNYPSRVMVDKSRIQTYWHTKNYLQYDISGKGHKSQDQRAYYLDGKHGTLPSNGAGSKIKVVLDNGDIIKLTPLECERLQTVTDGYTSYVSDGKRLAMLGNGWTVDVIVHLLKNIKP